MLRFNVPFIYNIKLVICLGLLYEKFFIVIRLKKKKEKKIRRMTYIYINLKYNTYLNIRMYC